MTGFHRQMLGHLVRRGAAVYLDGEQPHVVSSNDDQPGTPGKSPFTDVKPAEAFLVLTTILAFLFIYASLKYTLGEVVSTLTMIENPSSMVVAEYQPAQYKDDDSADASINKTGALDETVIILKEKPITSSIRGTIKHLGRIGGFKARWRGLSIALVYAFAQTFLSLIFRSFFSVFLGPMVGMFLGSILATVALARIHMTWTHIMISAPSPERWYRRVPRGRTYFKALVIPTAIFAIAQHLTLILPVMVASMFGPVPDTDRQFTHADVRNEWFRLAAFLGTAAFVALAILLPANVTLTRVEASLLPDDAETIVSFDRTLGGAAANLVGFGKINFRALYDAAWRSFDKSSRIRLIKFYVKYFAGLTLVVFFFFALLVVEVFAVGGQRLAGPMSRAVNQMQHGRVGF